MVVEIDKWRDRIVAITAIAVSIKTLLEPKKKRSSPSKRKKR